MKEFTTHRKRRTIDYLFVTALMITPLLLRSKRVAKKPSHDEAMNTTLFNGLSKTSVGIKPALPSTPIPKILDAMNVFGFFVSPKANNGSKKPIVKRIFKAVLLAACVHILLRDKRTKKRFEAAEQNTGIVLQIQG
jgi:hypothetical protein